MNWLFFVSHHVVLCRCYFATLHRRYPSLQADTVIFLYFADKHFIMRSRQSEKLVQAIEASNRVFRKRQKFSKVMTGIRSTIREVPPLGLRFHLATSGLSVQCSTTTALSLYLQILNT